MSTEKKEKCAIVKICSKGWRRGWKRKSWISLPFTEMCWRIDKSSRTLCLLRHAAELLQDTRERSGECLATYDRNYAPPGRRHGALLAISVQPHRSAPVASLTCGVSPPIGTGQQGGPNHLSPWGGATCGWEPEQCMMLAWSTQVWYQ